MTKIFTQRKITPAFIFLLSILAVNAFAQGPVWTWMSGDNTTRQVGIYGTKGVADAANKPGSRWGSARWTDAAGNLWMFGGQGGAASYNYLNDLWKYNIATGQWVCVSGDNALDPFGVYGTAGVAGATSKPGGRNKAMTWTDASGNFWLYGGYGGAESAYGWLNDLWKYSPSTNEWTWVNGDKTPYSAGIYGVKGVASTTNKPGGRTDGVTFTDASGNLWLFGGTADDINGAIDGMNDLWKYTPSTNEWTWVSGDNTMMKVGVYGTKGIADAANKPGGRSYPQGWTDAAGNFWVFGGYGYDETGDHYELNDMGQGNLNDLWKYNLSTNEWTWMGGDKGVDVLGVYGTKGIASPSNKPGARYMSVSWKDPAGDFWMLGGGGFAATSQGRLNDIWKFSTATTQWTWMGGDNTINQSGVYGTKGLADPSNKIGARFGAASWVTTSGCVWIFGGIGNEPSYGELNDLWSSCSSNTIILPIKLINFTGVVDNKKAQLLWTVDENETGDYFDIERATDGINFSRISLVMNTSNKGTDTYTYADATFSGTMYYRLKIVNKNNFISYSKIISLRTKNEMSKSSLSLLQNPITSDIPFAYQASASGIYTVTLYTAMGGKVLSKQIMLQKGLNSASLSLNNNLSGGTYILEVSGSTDRSSTKVIRL